MNYLQNFQVSSIQEYLFNDSYVFHAKRFLFPILLAIDAGIMLFEKIRKFLLLKIRTAKKIDITQPGMNEGCFQENALSEIQITKSWIANMERFDMPMLRRTEP